MTPRTAQPWKEVQKVTQIAYHRNGICGEGFYAILFESKHGPMVATVFEERGQVAVMLTAPLANQKEGVTFGENSWRGDHFEDELRAAIKAYEAERDALYDVSR